MTAGTILPTQTCFDDVLDHQVGLLQSVRQADRATALRQFIVHGICLAPEGVHAGEPFAHAWVEDDEARLVSEAGLLNGTRIWWSAARDEWEAMMRVQQRTRYTLQGAVLLNHATGHYGPWVPAYRALCGGGRVFRP